MECMFQTYSFRSLCLLRYSIEYYIQNFEKFFVFGSMDASYPGGKHSSVVTYVIFLLLHGKYPLAISIPSCNTVNCVYSIRVWTVKLLY
jgi:hypothetical protein